MRNRNLVIVAILSIIASTITGILVSTYAQQVNAQNQTGSTSSSSTSTSTSLFTSPTFLGTNEKKTLIHLEKTSNN